MEYIPLSFTSSLCNLLFLNPGIYGLVQATVGVGTVLIWEFLRSLYKGGGGGIGVAVGLLNSLEVQEGLEKQLPDVLLAHSSSDAVGCFNATIMN